MTEPQTVEEIRKIIDTYMPTVITGIDHISRKAHEKDREDWDADDMAIMAAYSYAHHMIYRLAGRQDANPDKGDLDLPSIIDLMENLKRRTEAIDRTVDEFPETAKILGRYVGRMYGA